LYILCVGAFVCVCIFVCLCCTLRPGSPAQNAGAAVPYRHTTHTHSPTYTHTHPLTHAHFPTHAQTQNSRLRQTTVKLGDGEEYQGQLSSNVPHGYGRAKFKSGCEYRGVWLNGQVRSWMYICIGWICTSLSYFWFLRWSSQSDVLTLSHPRLPTHFSPWLRVPTVPWPWHSSETCCWRSCSQCRGLLWRV